MDTEVDGRKGVICYIGKLEDSWSIRAMEGWNDRASNKPVDLSFQVDRCEWQT
jgi:hypothetical protein